MGETDDDQEDVTVSGLAVYSPLISTLIYPVPVRLYQPASLMNCRQLHTCIDTHLQAYKLGLDRPSIQDQVWETYRFENGVDLDEEPAAALAFENTPEEHASIQLTLAAAERSRREAEQREVLREQGLQRVRRGVKTGTGQSFGAAANGAVGLALGLAVVKGVGLLAQQLRRLRKPKVVKGKGKPKAPQGPRPAAAATAAQQASKAPPSPAADAKAAAGATKPKSEAASPQARARASARKR